MMVTVLVMRLHEGLDIAGHIADGNRAYVMPDMQRRSAYSDASSHRRTIVGNI